MSHGTATRSLRNPCRNPVQGSCRSGVRGRHGSSSSADRTTLPKPWRFRGKGIIAVGTDGEVASATGRSDCFLMGARARSNSPAALQNATTLWWRREFGRDANLASISERRQPKILSVSQRPKGYPTENNVMSRDLGTIGFQSVYRLIDVNVYRISAGSVTTR